MMNVLGVCEHFNEDYMTNYSSDEYDTKIYFRWKEGDSIPEHEFVENLEEYGHRIPNIRFNVEIKQNNSCTYMTFSVKFKYYKRDISARDANTCYTTKYEVRVNYLTEGDLEKIRAVMANISTIIWKPEMALSDILDEVNTILSFDNRVKYSVKTVREFI